VVARDDRPRLSLATPRIRRRRRFTVGLITAVLDVLAAHGYPVDPLSGGDYIEMRQALFGFVYGPTTPEATAIEITTTGIDTVPGEEC
jgi:hypothetical protein